MRRVATLRIHRSSLDQLYQLGVGTVTNAFPVEATLERLDVRDSADESVIMTLEGAERAAALSL